MRDQIRLILSGFSRILLVLLVMTLVTACDQDQPEETAAMVPSVITPQPTSTYTAAPEPSPTDIPTQLPTATATPTETLTPTDSPTPVCLRVLSPSDGMQYPELGKASFEWEPVAGAVKYRLEIHIPEGNQFNLETFLTSIDRYLVMYPWGGTYSWQVVALRSDGSVLCSAGPFSFNKPTYFPTPNPVKVLRPYWDSSGKYKGGG